jgi:hypothetical protein
MVRAQGGDDSWVADVASTAGRHIAKFTYAVCSPRDGVISGFSPASEIGMVAVGLGAGRLLASDNVDPAAGVYMCVPLFTLLSFACQQSHHYPVVWQTGITKSVRVSLKAQKLRRFTPTSV